MLGTETVGFARTLGEGDDGNPIPGGDWTVENCNVQSGSGSEQIAVDRNAAAQTLTIYLPAGAPAVDHRVTVTVRGLPGWRIVGDPLELVSDEGDPDLTGWVLIVTRGKG